MDHTTSVLKQFGLSDNEVAVYLAALQCNQTSPYELSKITGIARTTVYDIITDLSLKGLLELEKSDGFTKQQTKIKAKNPSTLREQVRKKHDDLYKLEVDLVSILPELKAEYSQNKSVNSHVKYYPGIEGAKIVFEMENDIHKSVPLQVIAHLMPMDALGSNFINEDVDKATQKVLETGQLVQELIPLNDWTKHVLSYQLERNSDYLKTREFRYIDNPIFEQYQRIVIAGNQILIICTEQDEAWGVTITSKFLTLSFQSIFNLLWTQAKPVTVELVESWG